MPEPDFTPKKATLTFDGNIYFSGLTENAALIAGVLQLGRDEAGILDKKLSPDLLRVIGKVIELLHDPEYKSEAERELAAQSDPDAAIAILRQSFRVRSDRVRDLLVRKLTELCRADDKGIAKEAVREAAGSALERLSQLADEVFLNVGTPDELQQVAGDRRRTLNVRIRSCHLLIEQHRHVKAVPIALELFAEGARLPAVHEPLRRLSKAFNALKTLDQSLLQEKVVTPLLDCLEKHGHNTDVRQYLLWAVGELFDLVLTQLNEISPWEIERNDMWLALALRQCAFHTPAATQLMIDWMRDQDVDDRFRLELSRRIKDKRVKFSPGAAEDLTALLDELPYRYEDEMHENLQEAIRNATGKVKARQPKELYAEILEQYREDEEVEDELLWDFRNAPGGLNYLHSQLKRMDDKELGLVLEIVHHERFKGRWAERLRIVLDAYPQFSSTLKREALRVIYELARNEPQTSKDWRRANEFLAELVDAGGEDAELARQYWSKLGD